MEFVGPGVDKLSADFRIGIDVMTTETTCLSSIWKTDEKIREFYEIHGREDDYKELNPGAVTYLSLIHIYYRLYRNSIGDRAERHNFSQINTNFV